MSALSSVPLISSLDPSNLTGGNVASGGKPSKLHEAAQQFEALLVGEMMKSVRESSSDGWLGSGDDNASESAMGMAEGQFSKALSMSGGLGLTKMIEQSVGAESAKLQHSNASHLAAISQTNH